MLQRIQIVIEFLRDDDKLPGVLGDEQERLPFCSLASPPCSNNLSCFLPLVKVDHEFRECQQHSMAQIVENPLLYWPASLALSAPPRSGVSAAPACVASPLGEAGPTSPTWNSIQQASDRLNAAARPAESPKWWGREECGFNQITKISYTEINDSKITSNVILQKFYHDF